MLQNRPPHLHPNPVSPTLLLQARHRFFFGFIVLASGSVKAVDSAPASVELINTMFVAVVSNSCAACSMTGSGVLCWSAEVSLCADVALPDASELLSCFDDTSDGEEEVRRNLASL